MEVAKALEEKQQLILDILHLPPEEYQHLTAAATADDSATSTSQKDAKEVLLAALAQGNLQHIHRFENHDAKHLVQ